MSSPTEIGEFATKLRLVLQASGIGRSRLAQLGGVDKSVASRWLSGQVRPSDLSLERLSDSIRSARPDFRRTDWNLPVPALAAKLGVAEAGPLPPAPPAPASGVRNAWDQPGGDVAALEAIYGGLWLFFHASMQGHARITCCLNEFRREGGHLIVRVGHTGVWRGIGPVMAHDGKLFISADDVLQGGRIALWIMWGVQVNRAEVLDGLNMTTANDLTGSVAATRSVALRIAGHEPDATRAADRFERAIGRFDEIGTLGLAGMLAQPMRDVFIQPPPVEGLPCVQRVTASRTLAASRNDLLFMEPADGPRRRSLAALAEAFADL